MVVLADSTPEPTPACGEAENICISLTPEEPSQTYELGVHVQVTSEPWLFRTPDNVLEIIVQVLPTFMLAVAAIAVISRNRNSLRPVAWFWVATVASLFLALLEALFIYQLLLIEAERLLIWQVFVLATILVLGSVVLLRIAIHPVQRGVETRTEKQERGAGHSKPKDSAGGPEKRAGAKLRVPRRPSHSGRRRVANSRSRQHRGD